MKPFKAFRIHSEGGKIAARFEQLTLDDLAAGDVVIRVSHSSINYKDALAATGAGKILRRYPLVGGIDLAGVVESSADARFKPGEAVLVTGCGLSETHDGGYAEYARVPGDWVIPMPPGLDAPTAMAIGTAGFTAALAIHRMEQNGQSPQGGPVAVTGATRRRRQHRRRHARRARLQGRRRQRQEGGGGLSHRARRRARCCCAASSISARGRSRTRASPAPSTTWAGEVLAWLTRCVDFWGNIASIGLAGGPELKTTVMPFILRGVALLGINSSATRARVAARRVAAHRHRSQAAPPGAHRHPQHRLR